MTINTIKNRYPCGEDTLYEVSRIIIENLTNDRTPFSNKKPKYTLVFIDGLKTLRTDAMALPDEESRSAVHETVKNLLPALLIPVKDNFNDLKGYIRDAWPNEKPEPRYEDAGLLKYQAIKENNWEAVTGLNEKMKLFISNPANAAKLGTPGGMPLTFAAKVDADALAFDEKYQLFMVSKDTTTARNAKVTANNALYAAIMSVCEDGVGMIYRTDDAGRKRYTFAVIQKSVSAPGATSLKIMAKRADDTLVMSGQMEIKMKDQPAIRVDILNGVALFAHIQGGDYDGHAIINGTVVSSFEKKVEPGTDARLTIKVD